MAERVYNFEDVKEGDIVYRQDIECPVFLGYVLGKLPVLNVILVKTGHNVEMYTIGQIIVYKSEAN